MAQIRSRRDLATLLERQMAAASTRYGATQDDDIEARTALKTYLLEAHGRMRSDPKSALAEVAAATALELQSTDEPELLALTQGEASFWLDVTDPRFPKLYTTASVKDADRVHESMVQAGAMLECVWLLPRRLETLAERVEGRMVLFSLRHDRRPLRRDANEDKDHIEFVTLRFWAPSAQETLGKLRTSSVLPRATSVNSARVRLGNPEAYVVAEVFHNGKITAVGTSFVEHERLVRAILDDHVAVSSAAEAAASGGKRLEIAVHWTLPDLRYAVLKMFSGADPFRLWAIPIETANATFQAYAVDVGTGHAARFEVTAQGVSIELPSGVAAGTAVRFASALQYHVNADVSASAFADEPLLVRAASPIEHAPFAPYDERAHLGEVARIVLAQACGQWIRGAGAMSAAALVAGPEFADRASAARADLAKRVMSEAAAHEWREWLRPVLDGDGLTQWKWLERLPVETASRARELARLNKQAQALVARLAGGQMVPWLQLSLFEAQALVPPVPDA